MTVLLPEDGRDVNDLFLALDPGTWQAIVNGMSEQRLMLSLPRFRIEYEESLVQPLRSMGMVASFTAQADFSRMSTEDGLYLSEVKHKSVVRVDETGTEAAAATAVTVSVVSAPPAFRVDRPFVFLIHERLSGTILFAGKVVLPEPIADEGR